MKSSNKDSGFIDVAVTVAAVCAVVLAIGLFIPALRPLTLQLGTGIFFLVVALGLGVLGYAGTRIVTYPSRSRKASIAARAVISK